MMEEGLLEEARRVYPYRAYNSLNTVGYKELFNYFDGTWTLDFALEKSNAIRVCMPRNNLLGSKRSGNEVGEFVDRPRIAY